MILVPFDAPGVNIVRPLSVLGDKESPGGHAEVNFDNVSLQNFVREGQGLEIATREDSTKAWN